MEPLRGVLDPYVSVLVPAFVMLTKDTDDDVRNNAVFGLGELCLHGGAVMYEHFSKVLQCLSVLLSHEQAPRVVDQIVGAGERPAWVALDSGEPGEMLLLGRARGIGRRIVRSARR